MKCNSLLLITTYKIWRKPQSSPCPWSPQNGDRRENSFCSFSCHKEVSVQVPRAPMDRVLEPEQPQRDAASSGLPGSRGGLLVLGRGQAAAAHTQKPDPLAAAGRPGLGPAHWSQDTGQGDNVSPPPRRCRLPGASLGGCRPRPPSDTLTTKPPTCPQDPSSAGPSSRGPEQTAGLEVCVLAVFFGWKRRPFCGGRGCLLSSRLFRNWAWARYSQPRAKLLNRLCSPSPRGNPL